MKTKPWWIEIPFHSNICNFRWQPISNVFRFDSLNTLNNLVKINRFLIISNFTKKLQQKIICI